jgi:hypothetical protein
VIDPRLSVTNSIEVVNATVVIANYADTDELSLVGSLNAASNGIYAIFSNGKLTLNRALGYTGPIYWTNVLSSVVYRFSDTLKPCEIYRKNYFRHFTFQVYDRSGRSSNIFLKGLTIETGMA